MRLYIWEGNGISDAYDDDGTLVILAESPEEARALGPRMRSDGLGATKAAQAPTSIPAGL